jgi:hypothetical protein
MNRLRAIAREILGLFVDDSSFACAILSWLLLAWLIVTRWPALGRWSGILLFAGLALILIESTARSARRHWTTSNNETASKPGH